MASEYEKDRVREVVNRTTQQIGEIRQRHDNVSDRMTALEVMYFNAPMPERNSVLFSYMLYIASLRPVSDDDLKPEQPEGKPDGED